MPPAEEPQREDPSAAQAQDSQWEQGLDSAWTESPGEVEPGAAANPEVVGNDDSFETAPAPSGPSAAEELGASVSDLPAGETGMEALESVGNAEPIVLTIGDIGVTERWITTPNGYAPLKGSQWIITDRTITEQKIPTWAWVACIIGLLACLLGLLFLLVKEEVTTGYVQVSVRSGNLYHVTEIRVTKQQNVAWLRQLVSQAQSMAAAAPPAPAA